MAVRANFELFDIIDANKDFSISATDLSGNTQTITSSANTVQYMIHKYGTRYYPVLRGGVAPTISDAKTDFNNDFKLWLLNRQHNIDKLYQSMFDYDYSPIENVDRYESETINKDVDTTYGKAVTEGGSDSVAYGKTHTKTGNDTDSKTGTDIIAYDGSETNVVQKAGFNSPNTYTPDTKSIQDFDARTDRTTYNTTETFGHNTTDTDGGTDRTTYGKTITDSGSDSVNDDTIRTLRVHGNIGVTSNVQLLTQEEEYRLQSLAELLIDNFIDDYTFYS